jgi:hypothetical protein
MIAPIALGLYSWNHLKSGLKLLVVQSILGFVVNLFAGQIHGNHWIFNIYLILDFVLVFSPALYFIPMPLKRWFGLLGSTAFAVSWLVSVYVSGINQLSSYALILSSMIIALGYFMAVTNIFFDGELKRGLFIILMVTFVYYCSIIPLYSFFHYMNVRKVHSYGSVYGVIIGLLCIGRYVGTAIGFFLLKGIPKKTVANG